MVASPILRQSNWQQVSDHKIDVTLIHQGKQAFLDASQQILYTNNSPDTLNTLYLHLWPNAYRHNQTPFAQQQAQNGNKNFLLPQSQKGSIQVSNLKQNGVAILQYDGLDTDMALITLNTPLLPGEQMELSMDFYVTMPGFYSRMGANERLIAATQWYPKPAVYDVNGWNPMPYLDQGEFYSELGSYVVSITCPSQYLVASTGRLVTGKEQQYLSKLSTYYKSEGIHSWNPPPNPFQETNKTLVFTQDKVHDFAWFASPEFKYVEKRQELTPQKTVLNRYFSLDTLDPNALHKMEISLDYYSQQVGLYPYDFCTLVSGDIPAGGGMEYPTITICQNTDLELVLHEIGHNWFYGILATNERRWPWMDESLNTFYEQQFMFSQYPSLKEEVFNMTQGKATHGYYFFYNDKLINLFMRRLGEDQPGDYSSEQYIPLNYYSVIYGRVAHYIGYIRDYLGIDTFNQAIQHYFNLWKFKHPLPGDFIDALSDYSGKDLGWFLDVLLPLKGGTSFEIRKITQLPHHTIQVALHNANATHIPLSVGFINLHDSSVSFHQMIPPFSLDTSVLITLPNPDSLYALILDPGHFLPENHRRKNVCLIPVAENLEKKPKSQTVLRVRPTPENPYTRDINLNPAVNYTIYSGWGFGVSLFNRLFPLKPFEYDITAYYTLGSQNWIGNGGLGWNHIPQSKTIERVRYALDFTRYDFKPDGHSNSFNRLNPNVVFHLKHHGEPSQQVKKMLRAEAFLIGTDYTTFDLERGGVPESEYFNQSTNTAIARVSYLHNNYHALRPYRFAITAEGGVVALHNPNINPHFSKVDARYAYAMNQRGHNRKFKINLNAGMFLHGSDNLSGIFKFRGSGNQGLYDYTYSETMLGRSESLMSSLWGQQLVTAGGDMRVNLPSFISNAYASVRVEQSLPLVPFVRAYADLATDLTGQSLHPLYWVGGLSLVLVDDLFEIYMPLFMHASFYDVIELNNYPLFKRLAFKIDLNYFYPRKNIEMFRPLFGF